MSMLGVEALSRKHAVQPSAVRELMRALGELESDNRSLVLASWGTELPHAFKFMRRAPFTYHHATKATLGNTIRE